MNKMKKRRFAWSIVVLLVSLPILAAPINEVEYDLAQRAFVNARIVGVTPHASVLEGTLLVNQGKIEKIQPTDAPIPANYAIIDLENKWVMPGMIDGHIHLSQSGSAFTRPDMISAQKIRTYDEDQSWLKTNRQELLKTYLKVGVTSVFDLGGPSSALPHYVLASASTPSPDIYAAGELISTQSVPELDGTGQTFIAVNSADEALAAVKAQLGLPVHTIKFVWTNETSKSPQALYALYVQAMKLAKKMGRIVAVHVEDLAYAKMAIRAGADILVHGVMSAPVDDEFLQMAKQYQVTYMPTLSAFEHYKDIFSQEVRFSEIEERLGHDEITQSFTQLALNKSDTGQMFQVMTTYMPFVDDDDKTNTLSPQEKQIVAQLSRLFSTQITDNQKANLLAVINAGIPVALGTDAGNPATLHGVALLGEIAAWINAGVPVEKVIETVTWGNAKAFGIDHQQGSLTSGKDASFVVYEQDPRTKSITHTLPVTIVLKGQPLSFL